MRLYNGNLWRKHQGSLPRQRYLVVKGCAGLGNRLFAVCNAIGYCKSTNRILFVDWADGVEFGKKYYNVFNDYFEVKNIKNITDWNEITELDKCSFHPQIWEKRYREGIYDLYHVVHPQIFGRIFHRFIPKKGRLSMFNGYWKKGKHNMETKENLWSEIIGICKEVNSPFGGNLSTGIKENILFYSDFRPLYDEQSFLTHIHLKPGIHEKIEEFFTDLQLNENTVGVHIRHTDKKPHSDIQRILTKIIPSLPIKNPRIFLSTDNKTIFESWRSKIPGLLYYDCFIPEVTRGGIHGWANYQRNKPEIAKQMLEDSIIQLWLLSKCQYLLYQGNSSFSLVAKILHGDKKKSINWDDF